MADPIDFVAANRAARSRAAARQLGLVFFNLLAAWEARKRRAASAKKWKARTLKDKRDWQG
jgi:hypothetical protein